MRLSDACRVLLAVVVLGALASATDAAPIPSKAGDPAVAATAALAHDQVRTLLAREDVARVLAAHGLSPEQAEARLARLSAEDLASLAANPDQVQAAGSVPNYIWILLAILMGVTILATVF